MFRAIRICLTRHSRRTMVLVATLTMVALLISGCPTPTPAPTPVPTPAPARAQWTFLVYMAADNNLAPDAITDFGEMAQVGSSNGVTIVVQLDLAPGSTWTDTRRFVIQKNGTPAGTPITKLGEINMGDPASLEDFVVWGVTTYPADHTLLTIWNHGGGWREMRETLVREAMTRAGAPESGVAKAIAVDDTAGDKLFMDEVAQALANARQTTQRKLDVVGFDACLMGMLEVAYEIRNEADYMVGSENPEPMQGWPYHLILGDLAAQPAMSSKDLAKVVVDRYVQSLAGSSEITQAAVDLSKIAATAGKVADFASALDVEWGALQAARTATVQYHVSYVPNSFWGADMWGFADQAATRVTSTSIQSAAQALKTSLDQLVIAEGHTQDMNGSHGTAIYFPPTKQAFTADPDSSGYVQSNTFMPVDFVQDYSWDEWLQYYYACSNPTGQPDLVVAISSAGSAVAGAKTLMPVTTRNAGGGCAFGTLEPGSKGYMVDVVLSSDTSVPAGWAVYAPNYSEDVLLAGGRISRTGDLAPGQEKVFSYEYETPTDTPAGSYYVCARIDPGGNIAEGNEANNTACAPLTITP